MNLKLWQSRIRLYMKCFTVTGKVCARLHSWGIITVSVGPTSCLALALSCWTFKKHFRSSSTSFLPHPHPPQTCLSFSWSRDNDKSACCRLILMFDSGRRGRFPNARVECLSFHCCSSLDEMVPWLWCTEEAPAAHSWNEESLVWLLCIYNVQNKKKSLKRSSPLTPRARQWNLIWCLGFPASPHSDFFWSATPPIYPDIKISSRGGKYFPLTGFFRSTKVGLQCQKTNVYTGK